MDVRVTILCENTVSKPGLLGEHGFSALVETRQETLLFDTGQGFTLLHNAQSLGKDLRVVDRLVLSHGHFDHTGGLPAFLGIHGPCDIVAHPEILSERFWAIPGGGVEEPLSIGLPWRESYLSTRGARFQWHREFTEISENVFVTGEVPRTSGFETGDSRMFVLTESGRAPDEFLDDLSLVVKTSKGLVIILGCAHAGTINIMGHAAAKTGEHRIYAIVGGTHLGFCSGDQLEKTMMILKEHGVERIAASHCTGQAAAARLASEFAESFSFAPVGYVLEV